MSSKRVNWTKFQHLGPWSTSHSCCHNVLSQMNHPQVRGGQDAPTTDEMDEVVELKDNVCGPIPNRNFEGKSSESAHTSYTHNDHAYQACRGGKWESMPTSPRLQVLHAYTMLTADSKHVLIMMQNMTDSAIFLKKGVCVVHVVSATLVPPEEVPSEEPVKGMDIPQEQMFVQE